jgi:uncharacterized protein (DUF433 family)
MLYTDYIESNASVMFGKPVIKGTWITVALILKELLEGATQKQPLTAYPGLSPVAINPALAYASDVISNETVIAVA